MLLGISLRIVTVPFLSELWWKVDDEVKLVRKYVT